MTKKTIEGSLVMGLLAVAILLLFLGFTEPKLIKVTLVNHSNCTFQVKINHVPTSTCKPTTRGPLITIKPDTAITIVLNKEIGGVSYHVPAFGVNKLKGFQPPILIGDQCTTFPQSVCDHFTCSPCVAFKGSSAAPMLMIQ